MVRLRSGVNVKCSKLSLSMVACTATLLCQPLSRTQTVSPAGAQDIIDVISLVSDSCLTATITQLQEFSTRHWTQDNHEKIARALRVRLMQYAPLVELDSFELSTTCQTNVVATIPGSLMPERELIVGGHFDSNSSDPLNAPGADDNGTGTAAVVEMARVLSLAQYHPLMTVRFITFAAEEAGLVGSRHYAEAARAAGHSIAAMLNFDMIGHRDTTKTSRDLYVVWYPGSESLSDQMVSCARAYTPLNSILTTTYSGRSDSYSFFSQGYNAVFCIEADLSPFYHTPRDLLSRLDMSFVSDVTKAGLALLLTLDQEANGVADVSARRPDRTSLEQNYPNPFNPSTAIGYRLTTAGRVTLKVYDLLGREIATLVNEVRGAGKHSVIWNAGAAASGVYFCRLAAGSVTDTKSMLLLR